MKGVEGKKILNVDPIKMSPRNWKPHKNLQEITIAKFIRLI